MSEERKSIWKRPWKGPAKVLGWFGLLAGAVFLTVCCLGLISDQNSSVSELVAYALIVSVVIGVLGVAIVLFVRWLRCWRNFRRFLFGVACFATLIALFYAEEDWRGKHEWEKYKHEWEAKGEKFDLVSLAPKPVPDDQNLAMTRLLKPIFDYTSGTNGIHWRDTNGWRRIGTIGVDLAVHPSTSELVLGSVEKGTFTDLEACRNFFRGNTNYPQPVTSGTAAADILVALGKFDAELKELREAAVARPYSRFPLEYDSEPPATILLPHLAIIKRLSILNQLQVVAKLEAGQSHEAFADLKWGFRLSDSIRDEPIMIDHLVRIGTLDMDLQSVREGLLRHAWSDAQLAELEEPLASVNLLAEFTQAIRGECAINIGNVDWARRQGFSFNSSEVFRGLFRGYDGESFFQTVGIPNFMPSGWFYKNMLTMARLHQEYTIPSVDAKARRVPGFAKDAAEAIQKWFAERTTPYTFFAKRLFPFLTSMKSAQMQTFADAARVACALERHRLANGKLPDTLAALTPRFIESIPTDVIDGKPLRYRLNPDGGYVLYSVGWNQTDDGGIIGLSKSGKTVDITKGDWVWQMPPKPITAAKLSLLH